MEKGSSGSELANGLAILLVAQFLAAYMGAYVEDVYAEHGSKWVESLFYTHFLCLPLFLPLSGVLRDQYANLAATPQMQLKQSLQAPPGFKALNHLRPAIEVLPSGIFYLLNNAVTQLACITGVNILCATATAVTVTIVLNIRKLVSFIFSTVLFGHQLSPLMIFGATLVFGAGALYGWETSWRLPQQKKQEAEANGSADKKKD